MCKVETISGQVEQIAPNAAAAVKAVVPFRFPKRFLLWCVLKTSVQLSLSLLSMAFIVQSGFFTFNYDASVWSREDLAILLVPQAIFEFVDFWAEWWMTMRVKRDSSFLPIDSLVHHSLTCGYYTYIYVYADYYSTDVLGLAVAGLSCQILGFLFTVYRLKLNWKHNGIALLVLQLGYRWPLAVTSLVRAYTNFHQVPWIHLLLCAALLMLDYRWTKWAFKLLKRNRKDIKTRKARKLELQRNPPPPVPVF